MLPMNQDNQSEPTLEESIKQVMQTLPPAIHEYLSQGKYEPIVQNLAAKYSLHVDQAGTLERETMLLLMGIETPSEFMQTLTNEAQLNQSIVNNIAQDINQLIFIPLRQQEEGGASAVPPVAASSAALASAPVPVPPPFPSRPVMLPTAPAILPITSYSADPYREPIDDAPGA